MKDESFAVIKTLMQVGNTINWLASGFYLFSALQIGTQYCA